jgi:alpha/beta superfamily hydrolase
MSPSPSHPLFLGPEGCRFFAQLLPAQGALKGAAVVCQPWGREGIQTHRAMHCLARDLAHQGIAVLRMALPGDTHSEGDDWQAQRVDTWLKSIHEGIDWLRTYTQTSHVHLIGLRTSATLAWQVASSRHDVASLVGMAPIAQGRLYVRELKMLQSSTPPHLRADPAVLEATGFIMTPETQQAFSALDLTHLGLPAPRVLALHRDDLPVDARWAQHLSQMGTAVTQGTLDDYAGLMVDSESLPEQAFKQIVSWVTTDTLAQIHDSSRPARFAQHELEQLSVMSLMEGQVRITEQALFIPGTTPMFAVSTQPASTANTSQAPRRAILMLNEGANLVAGPQRMWVQLARAWAANGYTVLRVDLTGLGDSPARAGEPERNIYSNVAVEDMKQAIAFLRTHFHAQDISMLGLCSGAYHGFLAAVKGLPIDRALMINPLVYHWEPGMSAKDTDALGEFAATIERQTQSAFELSKWRALLTGKISPEKVMTFIRSRCMAWLKQATAGINQHLGIRLPTRLSWQLSSVARRGVQLIFIFADDEIGLPLLQREGGHALHRSMQSGMVCIHRVEGGNHVFSDSEPRQRLMRLLHHILQVGKPKVAAAHPIENDMECSNSSA